MRFDWSTFKNQERRHFSTVSTFEENPQPLFSFSFSFFIDQRTEQVAAGAGTGEVRSQHGERVSNTELRNARKK